MKYITLLIMFLCSTLCMAETANDTTSLKKKKQKELELYIEVKDHLTHDGIDSTLTAELLYARDSSLVDTTRIYFNEYDNKHHSSVWAKITEAGKYFFKLSAKGYETKYVLVDIPKIYKREAYKEIPPAYLHKEKSIDIELDEIEVKATKLKFYMDGDTLVYSADAFSLAEGSMISTLVKKLPGVELKDGGEIYVNGRKVDSMLLNGKDFFNEDRELMLDEMPAYMVKNIQAYERTSVMDKGTNRENSKPKELVMNIKLKRDYNSGWMGNFDTGGGSSVYKNEENKYDKRLMGRLFAMRYSDKSRFTAYANANNVNDDRTPGEKGDWTPLSQSQGHTTTYKAGTSFLYGDWDTGRYNGSADVTYQETNSSENSNTESFLEGGNVYGKSFQNSRSYNFTAKTQHDLYKPISKETKWCKSLRFWFTPFMYVNKWNNKVSTGSTAFNEDVAYQLGKEWLDSISAPDAGKWLRKYAVNRMLSNKKGIGHRFQTTEHANILWEPPHNDYISVMLNFDYSYNDRSQDDFNHYRLDYFNNSQDDIFQNRYDPSFQRTHNLKVYPTFSAFLNQERNHYLEITYTYNYIHNRSANSLYLMNRLEEWNNQTAHSIGTLPSTDELLQTLDADNSTRSKTITHNHTADLDYRYYINSDDDKYSFLSFEVVIPTETQIQDYWRGSQVDTLFSRTTVFVSPNLTYFYNNWKRGRSLGANYNMQTSAPSMTSMLNIRNTTDPLNIVQNNPNLKNSRTHSFYAHYEDKFKRSTLFHVVITAMIQERAVASGRIYNKETGVSIVMPENVDGNWSGSFSSGIDIPLDKSEKWRIKDNLKYSYVNSVDLAGSEVTGVATRSVVGSSYLDETLGLTFRPSDKMEFGAKSNVHTQHSSSKRTDFTDINVCDFDWGVTAQVELPWKLQLSSDITMYSRRGYSEQYMNTNELVWNARLSKRMMKGNLTVMFDAFDILGNLSNVRRTINAQGKTETFYNVIPSYGMLHISYRLNKTSKKEPK